MSSSHVVSIGNLTLGNNMPIRIQSMTDTDTADIEATTQQILELINAGSEMVRITVDREESAQAVPEIVKQVRKYSHAPIIGDFHFNGHILLDKYHQMAQSLDKYRINPGNVGRGEKKDPAFEAIIQTAIKYNKAVRIGVNGGSIDPEILAQYMDKSQNLSSDEITLKAMEESVLTSAYTALKLGLPKEKIVLSVKHSDVKLMIQAYQNLAQKTDLALHLGLTEAGSGNFGIVSSSIALGTLLQKGIGDTIRVSITPKPHQNRTQEVQIAKDILQSLGLRHFAPRITSCPGCGRTNGNNFQKFTQMISQEIQNKSSVWEDQYPEFKNLHIAVMGCVVNGVGESQNADIGIFFPGQGEGKIASIYANGKKICDAQVSSLSELKDIFMQEVEKVLKNGE